jgi:hypothetical protein
MRDARDSNEPSRRTIVYRAFPPSTNQTFPPGAEARPITFLNSPGPFPGRPNEAPILPNTVGPSPSRSPSRTTLRVFTHEGEHQRRLIGDPASRTPCPYDAYPCRRRRAVPTTDSIRSSSARSSARPKGVAR